jgi:hypothetical protein
MLEAESRTSKKPVEENEMEQPNLKCGLCGATFNSEQARREHEATEHSAEVREKTQHPPTWNEEETAA